MKENTKKTILVVDDALTSRVILRTVFAGEYEVLDAENGRRAMEILHARPDVAVVVLDIIMPEMDGFAVLCAMRANEALRQIPVIVMTASSDEETQMKALSSGAMDVLYKPINPQVTQKRVENLIARMDAIRLAERNRSMERELREAETDVISGIYNKDAFLRRAAQFLRENPNGDFVLLRWDIDNFKIFNDVLGSARGDEYLRGVGEYYSTHSDSIPGLILYARYEADHFVSLYRASDCVPEEAVRLINDMLGKEQTRSFDFSPRIGLYRIDDKALDVTLMCDRALLALKSIKGEYGRHYAWYASVMRDELMHEHEIVNQMKSALAEGQFHVYFQPQYNYITGRLSGAEALVRWIHPEKGMIMPDTFIPIFENNGFIYELDRYIWEQACVYMKRWKDTGVEAPPISVSVNISRKDLYQPDMVRHICALPEKYGIQPGELHLEITESAYIDNPEQLIRVVAQLQKQGFRVEMDDFGSGYSSLNTLKNVPVDLLKLDMKFLSEDSNSGRGGRILSSIVRMAYEIDLPVIAEGVETQRQADYLKSIGCHYMQGYYFSRPLSPDDFETLLKNSAVSAITMPQSDAGAGDAADFMDVNTQAALLFNSFVGGAAILEYSEGNIAAIRINDRFFETLGINQRDYAKYQYHQLDRFTPESRADIAEALDKAIATGSETECEACSPPLSENGGCIWTQCRFRCLTRKVESYLFYMSINDITERKNLERRLERGKQELENLINSIPGGVATYEQRPDGFHLVYASDGVGALSGRTPEEYRQLLDEKKGRDVIYPADEEQTFAAINGAMELKTDVDINYRVLLKDGGYIWVNLRGRAMGKHGGYPLFFAVYHNLSVTTELYQTILDEAEDVLVVADRHTNELLFVNSAAAGMAGRSKEEAGSMRCQEYFKDWSVACDVCVAEKLGEAPLGRELDFRGRHYYSRITRIDWNGRDAYINHIADRTLTWNRQKLTDEILCNIPGGASLFHIKDGEIIREYLSGGAFQILGYTPEETPPSSMTKDTGHVYSGDLERLKIALAETIPGRRPFDMDMRILPRTGRLRWINLKANPVVSEDGDLLYYGLYSDITDRKRMEDELGIREQEYRLAAEMSGVNVYRYYIEGRVGKFNPLMPRQYDVPSMIPNMPDFALDRGYIAPESVEDWRALFDAIDRGGQQGEADICVCMPDHAKRWLRLRFSGVLDEDGRPVSAVISYSDITRETEKLLSAQKQADLDGMTGLYNHAATERIVSEMLGAETGRSFAFLLLDVDDLKYINDHFGHLEGDRALVNVAAVLKKHFRGTDIIGRIGGDEFVALLPGMSDEQFLTGSLRSLTGKLSALSAGESDPCALHCSIGCVLCHGGASDFYTAYRQADAALYQVKRSGKNNYAFYPTLNSDALTE